ncbi:MAG: peptidase dimerization domain-containing protein [Chloroflexi bacterium]|nr:peptidase dimerization domain-containing protein [Chloroflexota bacterium]
MGPCIARVDLHRRFGWHRDTPLRELRSEARAYRSARSICCKGRNGLSSAAHTSAGAPIILATWNPRSPFPVAEDLKLTDWPNGITANTGLISGGSARNTIPACAKATIDVRVPTIDRRRK